MSFLSPRMSCLAKRTIDGFQASLSTLTLVTPATEKARIRALSSSFAQSSGVTMSP